MNGPVSLDPLLREATEQLRINSGYSALYPTMLLWIRVIIDSDIRNPLTAIAHLAYGWMPTILKNFSMEDDGQRKLIADVNHVQSVEEAPYLIAKMEEVAPVNKSWVGTSKVLHFINPEAFPIWDSKVAKHFDNLSAGAVNKKYAYKSYLRYAIAHHRDYAVSVFARRNQEILNKQNPKQDPHQIISPLRSMESILFLSQQRRDRLAQITKKQAKQTT